MNDLPQIGGFSLLGLLGKGGMGEVYLALDEALGRRVALKMISKDLVGPDGELFRERFEREGCAMASLSHPNLVRIHSLGEERGRIYLVMELVQGGTLTDRIKRCCRLSVKEALEITGQVCDGLAAAWERGLLHRDIKPSNILFDEHGTAKIGDFGLAKPVRRPGDPKLTRTGFVLGSSHYLPPERAREEESDIRSDLYSLGIVLYEMLAGSPPFEGESDLAIVARHLSGSIPDVTAVRPEVPKPVASLVRWLTRREPADRPISPREVREEIDRLLALLAAPRPPRRVRRWALSGLAASLLLGVAFAGLAWVRAGITAEFSPPRPSPPRRPLPPATPLQPPTFALSPEASPTDVAAALVAWRTGVFGLRLIPAEDPSPRWRLQAQRQVFPILLALQENGDVHRLVPAGLQAGGPLAAYSPLGLPPQGVRSEHSGKVRMFLIATERPLAQPVILGAKPEKGFTFYPRRIGTADPVYPAHTYLLWLTGSFGGAAGAWDLIELDPYKEEPHDAAHLHP